MFNLMGWRDCIKRSNTMRQAIIVGNTTSSSDIVCETMITRTDKQRHVDYRKQNKLNQNLIDKFN